jgi:hypothetical protein
MALSESGRKPKTDIDSFFNPYAGPKAKAWYKAYEARRAWAERLAREGMTGPRGKAPR